MRTKPLHWQGRILADGVPVVLKIQSPDIVHKSEVGGVRLDLASEDAVRAAAGGHSQPRAGGKACTHGSPA